MLFVVGLQIFQNTDTYKEHQRSVTIKDSIKAAEEAMEILKNMIPQNQGADGVVWQVQHHLQKTLHNPKSYESVAWSKVENKKGLYVVSHSYRATNRFNAIVKETKTFTMNQQGQVLKVK